MPSLIPITSIRLPEKIKRWFKQESVRNLRPMTSEIIIALNERIERVESDRKTKPTNKNTRK